MTSPHEHARTLTRKQPAFWLLDHSTSFYGSQPVRRLQHFHTYIPCQVNKTIWALSASYGTAKWTIVDAFGTMFKYYGRTGNDCMYDMQPATCCSSSNSSTVGGRSQQPAFKIIFYHRPFRCLSSPKQLSLDVCYAYRIIRVWMCAYAQFYYAARDGYEMNQLLYRMNTTTTTTTEIYRQVSNNRYYYLLWVSTSFKQINMKWDRNK